MAPVHLAEVGVVGQAVEQGVDGWKTVKLVARQLFEHSSEVARVGNQDGFAARAHGQHHVRREGEDVVQRQSAHRGELLLSGNGAHHRCIPGLGLQGVGDDVAVQQHRPLGNAGGAAGVLQQGNVVGVNVGGLKTAALALGDGVVEAHGTGQVVLWHHFFDVAHHHVHQGALEHAQLVTHGAQHNVFDLRVRQAGLQGAGKVLNDDDGFSACVFELVLQLT